MPVGEGTSFFSVPPTPTHLSLLVLAWPIHLCDLPDLWDADVLFVQLCPNA